MSAALNATSVSDDRHPVSRASVSPSLSPSAWVLFALALFLLQVLPYLSHRWVTDESWYAGPGYSIAHGHGVRDPAIGPNDLENRFDARPPGTALVIATGFRLFGDSQISARLGSVLAGLVIVWVTYRLARDIIGEDGALLAMFVVATDNLIVLTSRAARPEALTTMFVLLALLAMKQYARKPAITWPLLSGLLAAAGTMFHITLLGWITSIGLLAIVLDRRARRFPLRGALAYTAAYLAGLVPFALWILGAPLGRAGFREEYLSRAVHVPLSAKFAEEAHRYADILGFGMLHGHGLASLPVRLPIPLLFLAATYLLWQYRRSWFWLELLLLLPTVLWLIYTVNKSSRYVALLAPVFALTIGAAAAAVRRHELLRRVMLGLVILVVIAQFGANLILLRAARQADYNRIGDELHSVIPPSATVYATITFWLAFHNQPFISYERTDPAMAANDYHARYFILGDRMMTSGSPTDELYFQQLNSQLRALTARATLVGEFPDPYYGDLKVYHLPER